MASIHPINLLSMQEYESSAGSNKKKKESTSSSSSSAMNSRGMLLKKSGTQNSLVDMLSPLAINSTAAKSQYHCSSSSSSSSSSNPVSAVETASTGAGRPSMVVVRPEHTTVRTTTVRGRWNDFRRSPAGRQTGQIHRLPGESRNLLGFRLEATLDDSSARLAAPRAEFLRTTSTCTGPPNALVARESLGSPFATHKTNKILLPSQITPVLLEALCCDAAFSQPSSASTTTTIHNKTTSMSSPTSTPSCNGSKSPHRRRASRSIAIKNYYYNSNNNDASPASRHQLDLLAAEEDSVSNERMYDWATWRMYNRIVDHRRNQHLSSSRGKGPALNTTCGVGGGGGGGGGNYCHHAMDSSSPSSPPHYSLNDGSLDGPREGCSDINSRSALDYIYDGEVFELEI